jgi:hypothetical protein
MYKSFEGFNVNTKYNVIPNLNEITEINRQFSNNYLDISNNLITYANNRKALKTNNKLYHYDDTISTIDLVNNRKDKQSDIYSVVNADVNELQLHTNSIYITGIIACATLLITALFIGKK